ncbi:MAG: hypothetical protein J5525_12305 [Lachnospiraceae bacterium]|nr:hypothetical protein [Lachnospiraceae bacterium]
MNFCKETVATVIDVFEDFLESKNITIENEDKVGDEGEAIIFGKDYDTVQNQIISALKASDIYVPDSYDPAPIEIKRDPYADITIFVPYASQIVVISEGDGSNLEKDDIEEGYTDYIYYSIYDPNQLATGEYDGGMLLSKEPVRISYSDITEAVPDILALQYGNENLSWILLSSIND